MLAPQPRLRYDRARTHSREGLGLDQATTSASSRLAPNETRTPICPDWFPGPFRGLTTDEVIQQRTLHGANTLEPTTRWRELWLLLDQFRSPLILLLIGAAGLSLGLGERTDAIIILIIVVASGLLSFFQQRSSLRAVASLKALIQPVALCQRDGSLQVLPVSELVVSDLLCLESGSWVPADCVILRACHLFVDEASLTGESFPVEKQGAVVQGVADDSTLASSDPLSSTDPSQWLPENQLLAGSTILSGTAVARVVRCGAQTSFGQIVRRAASQQPPTAFELGIQRFSAFLLEVTLLMILLTFGLNALMGKPVVESFLFALALVVGLTPQLLPAVISVSLARGAKRLAQVKTILKHPSAIENFGQMDVLCSDKTGTLTTGKIKLEAVTDVLGTPSVICERAAWINARLQQAFNNPMDTALLEKLQAPSFSGVKVSELPYDYVRKRLSVVYTEGGAQQIVSKGAVQTMLEICSQVQLADGTIYPLEQLEPQIERMLEERSAEGIRLLAVAQGSGDQEAGLTLLGLLQFAEPLKADAGDAVAHLRELGVRFKVITGDHAAVARHSMRGLGLRAHHVLTGTELNQIDDRALPKIASRTQIFAQVDPTQKERILLALQRAGHTVGYLGDGVNDVAALRAADVGIAVNTGAPAAKEAADLVLLEKDLNVLRDAILEGRRTFVNTLKYIYMATSANFGNMWSLAVSSLFLNFLPLLPKQVLLTNFLQDFPEMALASDRVDPERVMKPVHWDLRRIKRFMLWFGWISSLADFATFFVLLAYEAPEDLFRTAWFVESVLSAVGVIFLIRTRRWVWCSLPSRLLALSLVAVMTVAVLLPWSAAAEAMSFVPIPEDLLWIIGGIVLGYGMLVEVALRLFFGPQQISTSAAQSK